MVESQVNLDELDHYSQVFARRLTDYFFIDHTHIQGSEILNFSDLKQVNLLIIKNLFEQWQVETAKLKSPYFDYDHPKVQSALKTFMNTLSQYICIPKQHFYPLLREAARDALTLALMPKKFFADELKKPNYQPINAQKFAEIKKYIQYNKSFVEAFIKQLSATQAEALNTTKALEILDQVYEAEQAHLEKSDWILQNFSDISPLDSQKILPQPASNNNPTPNFGVEETQVFQEVNTMNTVLEEANNTPTKTSEEPRALNDVLKEQDNGQAASLHQKFKTAKLDNIRSAISLNQKFLFMNRLFNGDSFAFNDAINKIESCDNFNEAQRHIKDEYALKFDWDMQSEEVQDFLTILQRRFQ